MDRDTFTETLVEWMECARAGLHLSSAAHMTECDAYARLVTTGRDVLAHVRDAYGSSISDHYWLFDERDALALDSIKAHGFPLLVHALDPDFSIPEPMWGDVDRCMAYTMDRLEHHSYR